MLKLSLVNEVKFVPINTSDVMISPLSSDNEGMGTEVCVTGLTDVASQNICCCWKKININM
jgi:hypothetical protein